MSIYYGEHSIRFFTSVEQVEAYSFAGFNAEGEHCSDYSPDTWERWHLIPKEKPVFSPPGTEDTFITIPGRHGAVNLTRYTFGEPIYKQRSGSITFLIDPDYIKHRATIHSEMMAYFQGEERLAVLRDDRYYFYRGTFTVKSITPDKYWDEITLEYSLYPFKFERWSGGPWFWDDLDFETGVIRDYEKITEGTDTVIKLWPTGGDTSTCELAVGERIVWNSEIGGPTVNLGTEVLYEHAESNVTAAERLLLEDPDYYSLLNFFGEMLKGLASIPGAHAVLVPGILDPDDPGKDYLVDNGRVLIEIPGATTLGYLSGDMLYFDRTCMLPMTVITGDVCYDYGTEKRYIYNASVTPHFSEAPEAGFYGYFSEGAFYTDRDCTEEAVLATGTLCYDMFSHTIYEYTEGASQPFRSIFSIDVTRGWVDAKALLDGDFFVGSEKSLEEVISGLLKNYPETAAAIGSEDEYERLVAAAKMAPFYTLPILLWGAPVYSLLNNIVSSRTLTGMRYVNINTFLNTNTVSFYYCRRDIVTAGVAPAVDPTSWEEAAYWSDTIYSSGDHVVYNNKCYRCRQDILTPTGTEPNQDRVNWEVASLKRWRNDELYSAGEYVQFGGDTRIPLFRSYQDASVNNGCRLLELERDKMRELIGIDGAIQSDALDEVAEALEKIKNLLNAWGVSFDYTITGSTLENSTSVFEAIYEGLNTIRPSPDAYIDASLSNDQLKYLNVIQSWTHLSKEDGLVKEIEPMSENTNPMYVIFRNNSKIMPECNFGVHYRGKRL